MDEDAVADNVAEDADDSADVEASQPKLVSHSSVSEEIINRWTKKYPFFTSRMFFTVSYVLNRIKRTS